MLKVIRMEMRRIDAFDVHDPLEDYYSELAQCRVTESCMIETGKWAAAIECERDAQLMEFVHENDELSSRENHTLTQN